MKLAKLLESARATPHKVTLNDLIKLTKAAGFLERKSKSSGKKQGGSHQYKFILHGYVPPIMMNFQKSNGKKKLAKDYQVKQFLGVLDEYPELEENIKDASK